MDDEDYIRTGQGYIRHFGEKHEVGSIVYCGDHPSTADSGDVPHVVIDVRPPIQKWDYAYETYFPAYPHLVRRRDWGWK